ncbi:lactonase family protein [Terriglobus aquaticus]|uniref:Lactonase family protein n=1 Tax=Terriglobus aquaticus TaxID=940139 RepID=A0ABW9KG26_9BACT|nr:lactonase family protein [Terriglobus aquaticus]
MKFTTLGRITAALLLSAVSFGLSSCSGTYTVGFLYVLSSRGSATDPNGTINEYGIDYQTGSLLTLASSGQSTEGRNPTNLVVSPNQKNLYVINHDDSTIQWLKIGTDGKLYPQKVTQLDGIFPTGIAISADSGYMYVTFTYRKTSLTANSGPGGVEVYKLGAPDADGGIAIGAAVTTGGNNYFPVGLNPSGIAVGPNLSNTSISDINNAACVTTPANCSSFVYVIDQDPTTFNNLLVFKRDIGTGALTPIGNTVIGSAASQGYLSGVTASSVAVAPRGVFVYVTDSASNQIIGYTVNGAGALTAMTAGPFATGSLPVQMTIDPRGKFLYVVDQNDSNIAGFVINASSGALSASGTGRTVLDGTRPTCVTVENALGIYLYTSNFDSGNVSAFQLNSTTGTLSKIRNSPYPASAAPSCAAAVANGSHATELIQ